MWRILQRGKAALLASRGHDSESGHHFGRIPMQSAVTSEYSLTPLTVTLVTLRGQRFFAAWNTNVNKIKKSKALSATTTSLQSQRTH